MREVSPMAARGGGGFCLPGAGTERLQLITGDMLPDTPRGSESSSLNANERTLAVIFARAFHKAMEQGIDYVVVLMCPLIVFCVMSWSLSLPGAGEWLALIGMAGAAGVRIVCLNRAIEELKLGNATLREDNDDFKKSNVNLKCGVTKLEQQNKQFEHSIAGLEDIRTAIETFSGKTEGDFSNLLRKLQAQVNEQKQIQHNCRIIQNQTRNFAEMQLRAQLMNLFLSAQQQSHGREKGLTRNTFKTFKAMMSADFNEKLAPLLIFESIDGNRDGVIDANDMNTWIEKAVRQIFLLDEWEAVDDPVYAAMPPASSIASAPLAKKHFAGVYASPRRDDSMSDESSIMSVEPNFYTIKAFAEKNRKGSQYSLCDTAASSTESALSSTCSV